MILTMTLKFRVRPAWRFSAINQDCVGPQSVEPLEQRWSSRSSQQGSIQIGYRVRPLISSPCKQQIHLRETSSPECKSRCEAVHPATGAQIASSQTHFALVCRQQEANRPF